ncbi:uncharacterized protein CG3556-like [Cryptotermes secundus]|uniref:uncharacterized protein CG3556-like n=1 Tax=Cryptotermes secundus TaxID=105785 RepID=UPI000CD7B421|nr:uncharacterized protein CG3556-like [Cryptotermes secundus]
MQYLLLLFVILTTAKVQGVSEIDSCYSTEDITVPYTIWIGTNIQESHTTHVTVKRFTPFYGVMEAAGENDPGNFGFEATCSQYGHYITSIGGHSEDKSTSIFWLFFALESPPKPLNPPSSQYLSPAGVDGIHVVNDTIHYLFWLRNITDFFGQ